MSANPAIFEYDYKAMTRPFTEELMANRFHPNNMGKFEAWGYEWASGKFESWGYE